MREVDLQEEDSAPCFGGYPLQQKVAVPSRVSDDQAAADQSRQLGRSQLPGSLSIPNRNETSSLGWMLGRTRSGHYEQILVIV